MQRILLSLSLSAAIVMAQEPPTPATQSTAGRSAPRDAATSTTTEAPPAADGQFQSLPDQNVDPTATAPPPPIDVSRQKEAVASVQKAIPEGALSLAASIGKNILVVRVNGRDVKTFSVSVGVKGHQTPQGHFGIRHIVWNPSWHPPNAAWAKNKQAAAPGSANNPMKVVKIFFQEPDYYIHGTDHEEKLGAAASHGCIRMSQDNVYELGRLLQERGGAPRQAQWYAEVINGGQTASVMLPKAVPIVIGW
jgi:lipoprotein-anchoring transpeptidase ErfK/SrfK